MTVNIQLQQQITPELSLYAYNDIPVLHLQHAVGSAKIALQGAHLFSWQPAQSQQDILWLSEIEPFETGTAIRGGVPICYPWFGNAGSPAHGFARTSLWQLSDYEIRTDKVRLVFSLFSALNIVLAKVEMQFSEQCELRFTHYGDSAMKNVQVALHSYFNVADINHTRISNLPTECFNSLSQSQEVVPSPRAIRENVDCIYTAPQQPTEVHDIGNHRIITVEHLNAGNVVLWNPWHKTTSNTTENGYQTMVCVETARIDEYLQTGETVAVRLSVK
ncbi:D-hexose-6-phosphate mutarotase [Aggregatibacter kilianii]|mgnify:FL=1|jgi:aldose 1-epimerase|uniref:D-hexose-6-phosphate mutarotase n=1 Tax=Aggregatibacter kilianii TaxID=2025884 RepID=UPI00248D7D3D|nr:D-hexose-6-phosphate mutarotase [Aggregatibacter kilianii]